MNLDCCMEADFLVNHLRKGCLHVLKIPFFDSLYVAIQGFTSGLYVTRVIKLHY